MLPDSASAAASTGLGFLKVLKNWAYISISVPVSIKAATHKGVECLVARASEVEVVRQRMLATSIYSLEHYLHVELAPSFLFEVEGGLFER